MCVFVSVCCAHACASQTFHKQLKSGGSETHQSVLELLWTWPTNVERNKKYLLVCMIYLLVITAECYTRRVDFLHLFLLF